VAGSPTEAYSLTLLLDSDDDVFNDPGSPDALDAAATGLGSRLAALEMLLFPVRVGGAGATGAVPDGGPPGGTRGAVGGRRSRPTPTEQVPAVLFVWGPQRILPVRITTLTITETIFDTLLHPTHATVELGFRVLTRKECEKVTGPFQGVATAVSDASHGQRQALAVANLRRVADVVGFPRIPRI
jgi:hypothetical protein